MFWLDKVHVLFMFISSHYKCYFLYICHLCSYAFVFWAEQPSSLIHSSCHRFNMSRLKSQHHGVWQVTIVQDTLEKVDPQIRSPEYEPPVSFANPRDCLWSLSWVGFSVLTVQFCVQWADPVRSLLWVSVSCSKAVWQWWVCHNLICYFTAGTQTVQCRRFNHKILNMNLTPVRWKKSSVKLNAIAFGKLQHKQL